MKKMFFILIVVFCVLCGCTTESAMYSVKPLFSIIQSDHTDIEGDYEQLELLIHSKTRLFGTENLTISKNIRDNGTIEEYQIILRMNYTEWQFPSSLKMNIDGKILTLTPFNNKRNVISGNNVEETYYFYLSKEVIKNLGNAKIIAFQFFKDEVIKIDSEGIKAIKDFLS